MRTVKIVSREDPVTGDVGLMLRDVHIDDDMPQVDFEGTAIAHDLLEHQNGLGSIGTIIDELQALGGILFVRGLSGQLNRGTMYRSVEDNIGSGDLSTMFERIACQVETIGTVPVTHMCDADDMIDSCIGYFSPSGGLDQTDDEDQKRWIRAQVQPYKDACRAYMRIGWRKATRRYRGEWQRACNQFWAIADAVQPFGKSVEFEGHRFLLRYGMGKARMWEVEDDGSYF